MSVKESSKGAESKKDISKAVEDLSSLEVETTTKLVKALAEGFGKGNILANASKGGLSTRIRKSFADSLSIPGLSEGEKSQRMNDLLHLAVHMISWDPNKESLSKSLGVDQNLDKDAKRIFDLMKGEGVLNDISYRASCLMPSIDISSVETLVKLVKLDKPVDSFYPCAEIYLTMNQNGHERPVSIQVNRSDLSTLIEELGDVLQDLKHEEEIQRSKKIEIEHKSD